MRIGLPSPLAAARASVLALAALCSAALKTAACRPPAMLLNHGNLVRALYAGAIWAVDSNDRMRTAYVRLVATQGHR